MAEGDPSDSHAASRRTIRPVAIVEQVGVGLLTAFAIGIFDGIARALRPAVTRNVLAHVLATAHGIALLLPFGAMVGFAVGVLLAIARRTPWLSPIRARIADRTSFRTHDPVGFSTAVATVFTSGIFVIAVRTAALHFATRYHDPGLAAWAMSGTVLGLLAAGVVSGAAITVALLPLSRRLRPVATPLGFVLLVGIILFITLLLVGIRARRILAFYDPIGLAFGPVAVLLYLLVASIVRRRVATRGLRTLSTFTGSAIALAALATTLTLHTYGDQNRVRSLLEHRSAMGKQLVRLYVRMTDRDGDGYAWALGGGDCDDSDPRIHPGAVDTPGDGIDSDCFNGDGSPEVADFHDGHFGAPITGLGRPNVLWITVDALRPDRLGLYGHRRDTSPNLDRFAKGAVVFENVIAQSSRSIRSLPSIFTGHYPSQIAYGPEYLFPALLDENVTLAEVLRDQGYRTAVVMGTNYFERVTGFFQGFQDVYQTKEYRPPRNIAVDRMIHRLDRLTSDDKPFFGWVHIFNVHEPYLDDGTPSRFGNRPEDQYDTEIQLADEQIGRLLEELSRRGLEEKTIVVVSADHGEAFGEHQNRGHSFTIYDEELRSPLLLRVPGVAPGRVSDTVALFDLYPTLLNLVQVTPPRPIAARSLVPLMTGERKLPEDRLIFSEILPDGFFPFDQKAIRRNSKKLIWWTREGTYQLFDLASDPGEQRDLSDEKRDTARELLGLLRAWVGMTARPENRQEDVLARNRLESPPAMSHTLNVRFPGRFTLLGIDLPRTNYRRGERIKVDFLYRVESDMKENFFFEVDFGAPPGSALPQHFHAAHFPMNGRYHTSEWREGEILRDPVEIIVPYSLRVPAKLTLRISVRHGTDRVPFEPDARGDRILDLSPIEIR